MKCVLMIVLAVGIFTTAFSQKKNAHIIAGNRMYKEKQYEKAVPEYQKALNLNQKDPVASYNMGDAFFRNTNWDMITRQKVEWLNFSCYPTCSVFATQRHVDGFCLFCCRQHSFLQLKVKMTQVILHAVIHGTQQMMISVQHLMIMMI